MSGRPRILPVLVAGGGTTGLSLALFLAGHGVPCRLVERRQGTSGHPRARGINPRVMEVMRQQGLETEIRATASARALEGNDGVVVAESLVGPELGALDSAYFLGTRSDRRVPSPTGWCQCHQDEFEPVLRARAGKLGAVTDFGTELLSFTQDGDGVRAVLIDRRTGRTETTRARYLVAADGPRSAVRSALGIPFDGTGPFGTYLNIHFRAGLGGVAGRRCIICYVVNPAVRGGLMPLDNDRRWLLHVVLDPLSGVPEGGYDVERCRSLVRAATGIPSLAPEILGSALWHADARTAGTFRAGRVLLAGDAAHVMPPSGSFGANTGVLDAHNLAWKLAAVHRGHAGADLLDSYDAERRPVALATTRQAVLRSRDRLRLLSGPDRPAGPGIARDSAVWFGARYASSAVLAAGEAPAGPADPASRGYWLEHCDGLPGTRAPHVRLTRRGEEISALDLFGSAFVLLAGERAARWAEDGHRAARRLGLPLEIHRIGADGTSAPEDDWHAAYGITPEGAVLVRPDGIVGWRSPGSRGAGGRSLLDVLTALLSRTGAQDGPDVTSASRRV